MAVTGQGNNGKSDLMSRSQWNVNVRAESEDFTRIFNFLERDSLYKWRSPWPARTKLFCAKTFWTM